MPIPPPLSQIQQLTEGIGGRAIGAGAGPVTTLTPSEIQAIAQVYSASAIDAFVSSLSGDISAKYTLPGGGIPASDFSAAVQTSLGKADTAIQAAGLTGLVPYTGATGSVNLGSNALTCGAITASGTLTLQNSTTAVLAEISKTYTSGTDREYLGLGYVSGISAYFLGSRRAVSGSNKALKIGHLAADGTTFVGMTVDTAGLISGTKAGETDLTLTNSAASSNGTWSFAIGSNSQLGHGVFGIGPGTTLTASTRSITFASGGSVSIGNPTTSILASTAALFDIRTSISVATGVGGISITTNNPGTLTHTSGSASALTIGIPFAPTSGTGTMNQLLLSGTINQTGGASGITRCLYIAPTITAAADFRAIEVVTGKTVLQALTCAAITASGTLTLQNSTTAVLAEISKTFTSATDREYLGLGYVSGISAYFLGSRRAASGSNRDLKIGHLAADGTTFVGATIDTAGLSTLTGELRWTPPASVTLSTNGRFSVEMTSDTAGNLVYRGSDGTTRRMALVFV